MTRPAAEAGTNALPRSSENSSLRAELEHLAFHGNDAAVYDRYRALPEQERAACQSTQVLTAVIRAGIAHLRDSRSTGFPDGSLGSPEDHGRIERDLDQLIRHYSSRNSKPRELYASILAFGDILAEHSYAERALPFFERAEALGIRAYPELHAQLVLSKADLLFHAGRIQEAHGILSVLAERYYLVPDQNLIASILLLLGKTSLLTGRARDFKALLFSGLRQFYTRNSIRRLFTGTIRNLYRSSFRVFLDRETALSDKLLFLIHLIDQGVHRSRLCRKGRLDRLTRLAVLASVYFLNYVYWRDRLPHWASSHGAAGLPAAAGGAQGGGPGDTGKAILVTRAMGGIGDLLMMTPGLHAVKQKYPDHEIHLAVPRRYHALFQGNRDVHLLDIEETALDLGSYRKWFNFTDCPAARHESRTAPDVAVSRIDIFARALGIRGRRLRSMDRWPRYFLTEEDRKLQRSFWKDRGLEGKAVVGVQLQAAESYRDYPRMADLVTRLAQEVTVVLFHGEKTAIPSGGGVIDPGPLSLREAVALAAACDAIVAPDSAFVHFAGALDIPCVALYGPIDGVVRTKHYPSCTFVDARSHLHCVPCWRNERIPCKLTGMRNSACMENIAVDRVCEALVMIPGWGSSTRAQRPGSRRI